MRKMIIEKGNAIKFSSTAQTTENTFNVSALHALKGASLQSLIVRGSSLLTDTDVSELTINGENIIDIIDRKVRLMTADIIGDLDELYNLNITNVLKLRGTNIMDLVQIKIDTAIDGIPPSNSKIDLTRGSIVMYDVRSQIRDQLVGTYIWVSTVKIPGNNPFGGLKVLSVPLTSCYKWYNNDQKLQPNTVVGIGQIEVYDYIKKQTMYTPYYQQHIGRDHVCARI